MKAIIIGAGRGIRLMPETEELPKCMMDGVGGKRVLDWILESLAVAGTGELIDKVDWEVGDVIDGKYEVTAEVGRAGEVAKEKAKREAGQTARESGLLHRIGSFVKGRKT